MQTLLVLIVFCLGSGVCINVIDLSSSDSDVTWTFESKNGSITGRGSVPGGIYSDLQRTGVIGDILSGFNDVASRWVAYDSWTYTGRLTINQIPDTNVAHLVLEGVDTVAFVEVNGSPVGSTNNMFVRYVFDIKSQLKARDNEIRITFVSPVEAAQLRSEKHFAAPECVPDVYNGECHANQLRKMQASFSWDWGPAFPSVGLWKPVYIEFYNSAIIRSMTSHAEKVGAHWDLKIVAHLESSRKRKQIGGRIRASIKVNGGQTLTVDRAFESTTRDDGTSEAELNMTISENVISFWWPNGFGDQPLYDLHLRFTSDDFKETYEIHKQIGFRTLEVVEEDTSLLSCNDTAGPGLSFYFKVNGYPIFMKGSNWIPANILPELGSDIKTVDELLVSAREAHMAMLRVWGGGVYESDYFYQRCDQLGILIWQDFLFACSMYPADEEFLETVKVEIEQNVINLQHHPSIAIWAGNNENEAALRGNWYFTNPQFIKYKKEYVKLYVDTIKPIVEGLDPGRRYVASSPSNGKESEEEGYISEHPYDPHYGDTHYYNYLLDNWNQNIYPKTRFASEYGFQSLPSLATMRTATNNESDFRVDSAYSVHRQHSPGGYGFIQDQMNRYFRLDKSDTKYFEKLVFYSQISQAMAMKAETEFYRQSQADWYTMGALYWQLNDVWQAPSWSGIEYGGKWKMLHYFAKSFFAPVLVSPRLLLTHDVDIYLLNDRLVPIASGIITVDFFNWTSTTPMRSILIAANAHPLSSIKVPMSIALWKEEINEVFLRFSLVADGVGSSPYNYVFPIPFKSVKGLTKPNIQINVLSNIKPTTNGFRYTVEITTDTVVLFLWLETQEPGRFEDNGIIVTDPRITVNYVSNKQMSPQDLEKSIHYHYYMQE
ncbi:beta-mannosidase isoform X1 [Cydia strobilella]|uniref:beta-mannosidase isoform X1 n=1 Tax=Cydia strobilella TaxID=1100964 RepID=UPI003004DACC